VVQRFRGRTFWRGKWLYYESPELEADRIPDQEFRDGEVNGLSGASLAGGRALSAKSAAIFSFIFRSTSGTARKKRCLFPNVFKGFGRRDRLAENFLKNLLRWESPLLVSASLSPENERASISQADNCSSPRGQE
jgi:hypothetical protein